jgi:hypothetical protein
LPLHASTSGCGGVRIGPQINVPEPRGSKHTPVKLPLGPCTVQDVPLVFPLHGSVSAAGGAGGVGMQATSVPSKLLRHVPAMETTPASSSASQS